MNLKLYCHRVRESGFFLCVRCRRIYVFFKIYSAYGFMEENYKKMTIITVSYGNSYNGSLYQWSINKVLLLT